MTPERLRESPDGLVWPLYSLEEKERSGSVFTEGKLLTPSGRMKVVHPLFGQPSKWTFPKGSPLGGDHADEFPLVLTQGKQLWHWQQTLTNFFQSRGSVFQWSLHLGASRNGEGVTAGAGRQSDA